MLVRDISVSFDGRARHNIQNAMVAAAMALGLGVTLDDIRRGLGSFVNDHQTNPGRSNLREDLPFRIMV